MKKILIGLMALTSVSVFAGNEFKVFAKGHGTAWRDAASCAVPFTGGRDEARRQASYNATEEASEKCARMGGRVLEVNLSSANCSCYDDPYATIVEMEYNCSVTATATCSASR